MHNAQHRRTKLSLPELAEVLRQDLAEGSELDGGKHEELGLGPHGGKEHQNNLSPENQQLDH